MTESPHTEGRLRWKCRRGLLELDIMLENFLDHGYAELTLDEQLLFNELLNFPDQELLEYLLGQRHPESLPIADVVQRIRNTPAY